MPLWMYFAHPLMVITFFYQRRYSSWWNDELNRLIDADPHPEIGEYTAMFRVDGKKYEVWITNCYYSYGYIHRVDDKHAPREVQKRPSFRTMCRLAKLIGSHSQTIKKKSIDDFRRTSGFMK